MKEKSVYVDWKERSDTIVHALRESYKEMYPALADGTLDELAENYAAEEPEDFLKALGQELTALGLALYDVEDDSDSYRLMVVPLEQAQDFKNVLKSHKLKGTLQKQPRRKEGMAATRIDLGQRLLCEKIRMPEGGSPDPIGAIYEDRIWLHMRKDGAIYSAIWNLGQWPPVLTEKREIVVRRIAERENGLMAVIAQHSEINEMGRLADPDYFVLMGRDLDNIWNWKCLWKEKTPEWTDLKWYQDDLFIASGGLCLQGKVFRIKGAGKEAANSVGQPESLMESEPAGKRTTIFPKLFMVGGKLYLFMKPKLYEWKADGFLRKGGFTKEIMTIDNGFVDGFVPASETKVAFVTGTGTKAGDSGEGTLHVLDLISGEQQTYPCHCGYLHKWKPNRVCVRMPLSDDNAKEPMMECFDLDTGEKRSLLFGALGKDRMVGICESSVGTVLLGNSNVIYRTDCLWEFMETSYAIAGQEML